MPQNKVNDTITHVTLRATSNTRLRARDHALQALSLVEKVEPIQVHFTLRWMDQLRK